MSVVRRCRQTDLADPREDEGGSLDEDVKEDGLGIVRLIREDKEVPLKVEKRLVSDGEVLFLLGVLLLGDGTLQEVGEVAEVG